MTSATPADPGGRRAARTLLREIDRLFAEVAPAQHAVLRDAVGRPGARRLAGTAFTTAAINRNARMCYHRDNGNLDCGYSALTVIWNSRCCGGRVLGVPPLAGGGAAGDG